MIPILRAIASAVRGWSPVTINTLMPAILHVAIASVTPALGGSIRLVSPANINPY